MSKVTKKDLVEMYDTLQRQLVEDRETITKLYGDLKVLVIDKDEYAIHGPTLAKFAELMIKQTEQLVEIITLNQKNDKGEKDSGLDEDERNKVFDEISKQQ